MIKTEIINLWGGPGAGKSTTAAYLFSKLKMEGVDAELVREYVKDWVWEGRQITRNDQVYFLGKQIKRESMLYGKVQTIVTDAPVLLNYYYAQTHSSPGMAKGIAQIVRDFYQTDGVKHTHVLLRRSKPYNPNGRFQTETEAKTIDTELFKFLNDNLEGPVHGFYPFLTCDTDVKQLDVLLQPFTQRALERQAFHQR